MFTVTADGMKRDGVQFYPDGINDTTVISFALMDDPNGEYKFHNHNFPNYTGDKTTEISANSWPEFWDKYFTALELLGYNTLRVGGTDSWSEGIIRRAWAQKRALFDEVFDSMVAEARKRKMLVIFTLGGVQGEVINEQNHPMVLGSTEYNNFVAFGKALVAAKKAARDVVIWDIYNEPDHMSKWSGFWAKNGTKFQQWIDAVYDAISAADTGALFLVGTGGMNLGWSSASLANGQPTRGKIWNRHIYMSAEDAYLITDPAKWAKAAGKYLLVTEVAKNTTVPPWTLNYWPWYASTARANGTGVVWMVADSRPGYPLRADQLTATPADSEPEPTQDTEEPGEADTPITPGDQDPPFDTVKYQAEQLALALEQWKRGQATILKIVAVAGILIALYLASTYTAQEQQDLEV